jgi:recombinational DNA repair protein (RecF pathway)
VLAETWSLISHFGFAPALEECIACGRPIEDSEEVSFDYTAGGVRCMECGTGLGGRVVPAAARAALRRLVGGQPVKLERTPAHWRLLARFLSHHVLEGQTLHSLDFLAETMSDVE